MIKCVNCSKQVLFILTSGVLSDLQAYSWTYHHKTETRPQAVLSLDNQQCIMIKICVSFDGLLSQSSFSPQLQCKIDLRHQQDRLGPISRTLQVIFVDLYYGYFKKKFLERIEYYV